MKNKKKEGTKTNTEDLRRTKLTSLRALGAIQAVSQRSRATPKLKNMSPVSHGT